MNRRDVESFPKLRPPFSSPKDGRITDAVSSPLGIAYSRLRAVSGGSLGSRDTWPISQQKWFADLMSNPSTCKLPDIEMSEAPLTESTMDFIKWLSSKIRNFGDRGTFVQGLYRHQGTLRKHRMYSYETRKKVDLEFYDFRNCENELLLLAEGELYEPIDPVLKCLVRYAHFTAIHPFADGNGRGSRVLLANQLTDLGLWNHLPLPVGFLLHRDRLHYIRRMRGALLADQWNDYFVYMLGVLAAACELSAIVRYLHADLYHAQQYRPYSQDGQV